MCSLLRPGNAVHCPLPMPHASQLHLRISLDRQLPAESPRDTPQKFFLPSRKRLHL